MFKKHYIFCSSSSWFSCLNDLFLLTWLECRRDPPHTTRDLLALKGWLATHNNVGCQNSNRQQQQKNGLPLSANPKPRRYVIFQSAKNEKINVICTLTQGAITSNMVSFPQPFHFKKWGRRIVRIRNAHMPIKFNVVPYMTAHMEHELLCT